LQYGHVGFVSCPKADPVTAQHANSSPHVFGSSTAAWTLDGVQLVLLSNGYPPGGGRYLQHALDVLAAVLAGVSQVAFVPYAQRDWDRHTAVVADALAPIGVQTVGVHRSASPGSFVQSAQAVFVGGGNAFRLLDGAYRFDLLDVIRRRVGEGLPYIGSSAGTNLACPTIRTTNDMPIVEPPSLGALGLIPFQINPHYPAEEVLDGHLGETRDQRIAEFLEDNDVPVLGLQEGAWLEVTGTIATLGGAAGARLFQRAARPRDIPSGTDVSDLLQVPVRFDDSPCPRDSAG
jgi:dipeptidase E